MYPLIDNMRHFLKHIVTYILTFEARILLARTKPRIIAITGSVGKTSTKDAIFAVVSSAHHTRKSEKSFNSDIGVPLTILGLDTAWGSPLGWIGNILIGAVRALTTTTYPAWLVLEIGADHPGDISRTARWLQPHVVVITALPEIPVHVAYFPSPDDVAKEKISLTEHMQKDGILVINGDDSRLLARVKTSDKRLYTYGVSDTVTIRAMHETITYDNEKPVGMSFRVDWKGSSVPVALKGTLGRPRVYSSLAALAVADALEIDFVSASRALSVLEPTPGRMRIIDGTAHTVLIDDTYNSSPVAALSALETLETIQAPRRIAILGDMRELGSYSIESHKEVGKKAAQVVDLLITVGIESRVLAESARAQGMPESHIISYGYDEAQKAGACLVPHVHEGDVILIKGSQNRIRLERAVQELMAHKEDASSLLVRQEKEWAHKN